MKDMHTGWFTDPCKDNASRINDAFGAPMCSRSFRLHAPLPDLQCSDNELIAIAVPTRARCRHRCQIWRECPSLPLSLSLSLSLSLTYPKSTLAYPSLP